MSIEVLLRVLLPPEEPCDISTSGAWAGVEAELGIRLPADYRQFIARYGTGCIDDFLWVHSPFASVLGLNLAQRAAKQLDALRVLRVDWGDEEVPYAVFPYPNGLFPWAATDNGDVLYWITTGSPSEWIVAINESRGPLWEEYDCPMVVFLTKLLSKEIRSEILPEQLPSDSPTFRVVSSQNWNHAAGR